jgi:glycosyltransferase involved in cell wall biosynthesis
MKFHIVRVSKQMSKDLTIVIPAYNEQAIIGHVLNELKSLLNRCSIDASIIVVDDGSTDATAQAALQCGVRVLRHRSNRGYGASLKTGIAAANTEIIAITDADGTYPMKYLPEMLSMMGNTDMVVGARTGANVNIPLVRKPAKWLLNRLANYVTGYKIEDLNSGMRVFRREVAMQYFSILPDQFSWTTTITMAMLCDKYTVRYISIDYRPRTGRSKIVPWDAGAFTILILRIATLFKPLRVFLPLFLVCMGYTLIKTFIDLFIFGQPNISASAGIAFMTAIILLSLGMVADAITTRLGRLHTLALTCAPEHEATELTLDSLNQNFLARDSFEMNKP